MTPVCQPATEAVTSSLTRGVSVRAQIVLAACGCAGASAFLYAVDPSHHAVYPQCWLYKTTGIYCAGCGATRALYALLHGRVMDALHDNALLITALPLLLFVVGSYTFSAWQNKAWPRKNVDPQTVIRWAVWSMIVMLGFMLLRNLPGWPFSWLKPIG